LDEPTKQKHVSDNFITARQQSTVLAIVNPSVRPSVCLSVRHTLALFQNDSSYHHAVFIGG